MDEKDLDRDKLATALQVLIILVDDPGTSREEIDWELRNILATVRGQ